MIKVILFYCHKKGIYYSDKKRGNLWTKII